MIHRITPGDIIVTDNVAIEVGEDSQWEWSMGDRDKLVVRGRFLSNEPSTPEVATAEPDQSCCVNTLREAANEVREVSLEAADILVERARDLEKLIKETPVPAEPSQRVKYRAKIAAIIDEIGDYPFAATDEILAVRDTEMEQFVDFAGEQSNRVRELEAELARLRAEVAELAGLRERAIILPNGWQRQISDGLNVGHAYFPSTLMIGLVESWRAAPEPQPEWRTMSSAPQDGSTILGRYECRAIPVRWAEERVCMLASTASGAGRFGPGWEDVDNGLYIDDPEAWRPSSAAPEPATPPKLRPCDDFVGDGMRCDQPQGHDGRHSNRNW